MPDEKISDKNFKTSFYIGIKLINFLLQKSNHFLIYVPYWFLVDILHDDRIISTASDDIPCLSRIAWYFESL